MKRFRFVVPVSCLAAIVLMCLASYAAGTRVDHDKVLNDAIRKKLNTTVSVDFDEMPLTEVLDYFRSEYEINIVYDPPENENVEKIVNLTVTDMKAGTALRWVTKLTNLDSDIVGGVLYISTPDRVAQMGTKYLRQYDVRDLLATPRSLRTGGNDNNNDDDDDDNDGDNDDDGGSAAEDLLRLLTLFTGPQNWDHVEVMGVSSSNDDTESESREDDF